VNCKIVFIGAGNVATNLALVFRDKGFSVRQVYSLHEQSATLLADKLNCEYTSDYSAVVKDADFYFYCLPDHVLQTVEPVFAHTDALHLHTAGSVSGEVFMGKVENYGVFYPFQTFTKSRPVKLDEVPILVQANNRRNEEILLSLAKLLSANVVLSTDEKRMRLHLAGVIANNFTNCLYRLAFEQMQIADLPAEWLLPLIDETARKVHTLTPEQAQTGPARRGDMQIIDKHRQLLHSMPQQLDMYNLLTALIQEK